MGIYSSGRRSTPQESTTTFADQDPDEGGFHHSDSDNNYMMSSKMEQYNNNSSQSQLTGHGMSDKAFYGSSSSSGNAASSGSKRKKWIIVASVIGGLVILGAVLGGVLGTQLNKTSSSSGSSSQDANSNSNGKTKSTVTDVLPDGKTVTSTATSSAAATASATPSVAPLPKWDWTQTSLAGASAAYSAASDKSSVQGPMMGVALGNWLILEQWMDEQWFNASAGNDPNVIDEWTLMQHLGDNAASVMKEHYATYVTESDIATLASAGVNHLRVPLGFWTFIDTTGDEPYLAGIQKPYLENLLEWAYKHKMYVVLDMHGMPGSQNGEITSGHKTTNPTFYQTANLARANATVDAVLEWVQQSPYRSVVSALGVVNEPRPYTQEQVDMLQSVYQHAYDKSMTMDYQVPIQFHHAYVNKILPGAEEIGYWTSFVTGKQPGMIMLESHPYPGTFPLQSNGPDILRQVCSIAATYATFPAPVVITEWSIRTGINDAAYEREFYTQQLTAWSFTGGAIFWSLKVTNGSTNGGDSTQYSFLDLMKKGSIPLPSSSQSSMDFIQSLGSPCGDAPTVSWASSGGGGGGSSNTRMVRHLVRRNSPSEV